LNFPIKNGRQGKRREGKAESNDDIHAKLSVQHKSGTLFAMQQLCQPNYNPIIPAAAISHQPLSTFRNETKLQASCEFH